MKNDGLHLHVVVARVDGLWIHTHTYTLISRKEYRRRDCLPSFNNNSSALINFSYIYIQIHFKNINQTQKFLILVWLYLELSKQITLYSYDYIYINLYWRDIFSPFLSRKIKSLLYIQQPTISVENFYVREYISTYFLLYA